MSNGKAIILHLIVGYTGNWKYKWVNIFLNQNLWEKM